MRFSCPSCKSELEMSDSLLGREIDCPVCKTKFVCKKKDSPEGGLMDALTSVVGVERLKGFSWREFASEIFKRHSDSEVEKYFMVGTETTTPDIFGVKVVWPKPWVFVRLLVAAVGLYYGMAWLWDYWCQKNAYDIIAIPNILVIGSFAVPLASAVLFFEMNIRKNVSLYQVIKLIFIGGVLSLVLTDFLNLLRPQLISTFGLTKEWHAAVAGPVEETAKLLAVVLLVRNVKYRYTLNGLLFGAAVGVGFAMFESAGYAMRAFLNDFAVNLGNGTLQLARESRLTDELFHKGVFLQSIKPAMAEMNRVIFMRGVLAPIAHVAYSAIAVGALWRVKGGEPFSWALLGKMRFLRLFACAVALHAFWNSPLLDVKDGWPYMKIAIVAVVSWTIILSLVQEGIKQIQKEQENIVGCGQ